MAFQFHSYNSVIKLCLKINICILEKTIVYKHIVFEPSPNMLNIGHTLSFPILKGPLVSEIAWKCHSNLKLERLFQWCMKCGYTPRQRSKYFVFYNAINFQKIVKF